MEFDLPWRLSLSIEEFVKLRGMRASLQDRGSDDEDREQGAIQDSAVNQGYLQNGGHQL